MLHEHAQAYMDTPEARALTAQFAGISELIAFIRELEKREQPAT